MRIEAQGSIGMKVLKAGLLTTVQDLGRTGYRSSGISEGGAMDRYALRLANLLVGNEEGAAGLEITLVGPELEADTDLLIAVCGAYLEPTIDGAELPMWRPVFVPRGAALRFLLTRTIDWLNVPAGALVRPKDPNEYLKKLNFHRSIKNASEYGLSA